MGSFFKGQTTMDIQGTGSQPWMLQVGFSEPHDPEQVPAPYWDMFPQDKVPPRCAGPEALKPCGRSGPYRRSHRAPKDDRF